METNNPKVSVIVPVYKAEAYLRACVDSILGQTFEDFELLLVDDGSPDGSGAICDGYAARDSRVRVFHKANGGVSSARQCGLDAARGEYVIHADPDDWAEPGMLDTLYAKARGEGADMVICDFYVEGETGRRYVVQRPTSTDHTAVLHDLFQRLHGSLCDKLVLRACYKKYGIRFPVDFSFCEDLYVNASLLRHEVKVAYVPRAFYHYDQLKNPHSIVRAYDREAYAADRRMLEAFGRLLAGLPFCREGMDAMEATVLVRAFRGGVFSSKEFVELFKGYRRGLLRKSRLGWNWRFFLFLSCSGCYGPMKALRDAGKRARGHLLRTKKDEKSKYRLP